MHNMTEANLKSAFAGESQAHMRYVIFADKAEEEGYPNVAKLFRAIAYAERVHAANHLNALAMINTSASNLQEAIDGETFEVQEMYPAYKAVADLQDEKRASRSMNWALEAEKIHAGMYEQARQAVLSGKDPEVGDVYICETCGWTVEGQPPDKCPVCGAKREKFRKF
jgi:rubrerythrin